MRASVCLAAATAFFLAGCAGPSRHWSPYDQSRPADWHGPYVLLLRYDANNDGKITQRELEAGLRQDFWQADSNRDGLLDAEEVRATNLRRIRIDQSTAIPLIDWNHDGFVDFSEFAAPMRSLFEQYDADEDGVVTLSEMHIRLQQVSPSAPTAGGTPSGSH
jgi:Ca2+-binding EF-hand superfamily protein